jgi:tRNA dimethylallyltransferase
MNSAPQPTATRPLIAIVGPTGSGKSALALAVAREVHGEIVNCDSLQLYRGFDIGTAKTPVSERSVVPHHLFDVLTPEQSYSAGEYAPAARNVIEDITRRGHIPVVVGGSGFYLRALVQGLPPLPARDEDLRSRLLARESKRPGSLHRLLRRLEPAAAVRIHSNDTQKTLRALEIRLLTKVAMPPPAEGQPLKGYRVIEIGLNPDREALKQRLDARTLAMFDSGLVEEVQGLLASGATGREKPFESLGYKQALQYLRGECTRERAVETTQIETRQYAKRQLTWFRRDPGVHWFGGFGDTAVAAKDAITYVLALLASPGFRESGVS